MSRLEQNPELIEDFSHIWKTLETIKTAEEAAMSAGDYKRANKAASSSFHQKLSKDESLKKKSHGKMELYQYILQVIPLVIGWLLNSSIRFLEFLNLQVEKVLAESFNKIAYDLQCLNCEHDNFQTIASEFFKNLNVEKVFYLASIIFLPPFVVILKVLYIINKFLVFEIPFE